MRNNLFQLKHKGWTRVLLGVLLIFAVGCSSGSSSDSATASSNTNGNNGGNTGSLNFLFTQSQAASVPAGTTSLLFEFSNDIEAVIFTTEVPFAASVTVDGIPTSAVSVNITAIDSNGIPLAIIQQQVAVVADSITPVDLGSATITVVVVDTISVSPSPVNVGAGETASLIGSATYSDGSVVPLSASNFTYQSANAGIATVNGSGEITGVAAGSTTVEVGLASDPNVEPVSVTVDVAGLVFRVFGDQNLPINNGNGLTSGNYQAVFVDSTGTETSINTNDANLNLSLETALTGLTVTTIQVTNETRIQVTASNSDAAPGDTFSLVGQYTAPNGATATGSLLITVVQGQVSRSL